MAPLAALVHLSPSVLRGSRRARPAAFIGFQSGRGGSPCPLSSGLLCQMALDAALVHLSPSELRGSRRARPAAFIGVQSGRGGPPGWIHDDSDRPRWHYSPGSFLVLTDQNRCFNKSGQKRLKNQDRIERRESSYSPKSERQENKELEEKKIPLYQNRRTKKNKKNQKKTEETKHKKNRNLFNSTHSSSRPSPFLPHRLGPSLSALLHHPSNGDPGIEEGPGSRSLLKKIFCHEGGFGENTLPRGRDGGPVEGKENMQELSPDRLASQLFRSKYPYSTHLLYTNELTYRAHAASTPGTCE